MDVTWKVAAAALLALIAGGFGVAGLTTGRVHTFRKVRRASDMALASRVRDPGAYWSHVALWMVAAAGNVWYVARAWG